jgi:hypothetical protein
MQEQYQMSIIIEALSICYDFIALPLACRLWFLLLLREREKER